MLVDVCQGMRSDMCQGMWTNMCADMCIYMCIDMCIDMCGDLSIVCIVGTDGAVAVESHEPGHGSLVWITMVKHYVWQHGYV